MQNPFFNQEEHRLRAGLRIVIHLFLAVGFSLIFGMLIHITPILKDIANLSLVASALGFTVATGIAIRFLDKDQRWQRVGMGWSNKVIPELFVGTLAGFAAMALIYLVLIVTKQISFDGFGWNMPGAEKFWVQIFWAFLMMACVGYYEELFSRGYHLVNMAEGFGGGQKGVWIAVAVSSAIFGLLHVGNANSTLLGTANIMLAGLVLALPFLWTKRLYISIGFHFMWNFAQGAIFGFEVSGNPFKASLLKVSNIGPDWFTGGAFGPEGGLVSWLGMGLATAIIYFYVKKQGLSFDVSFHERIVHSPESEEDPS